MTQQLFFRFSNDEEQQNLEIFIVPLWNGILCHILVKLHHMIFEITFSGTRIWTITTGVFKTHVFADNMSFNALFVMVLLPAVWTHIILSLF